MLSLISPHKLCLKKKANKLSIYLHMDTKREAGAMEDPSPSFLKYTFHLRFATEQVSEQFSGI